MLLLPAVAGERLTEVSVPVQQTHSDERDAEVAGGLEVVPGEDPEPAGVLREGGGDTEFRGEVGDRGREFPAVLVTLVPPPAADVVVEVGGDDGEPAQEPPVAGQFLQPGGGHRAEQPDGIAAGGLPAVGVDRLEEFACFRMPRPAQVAREVGERHQRFREDGAHGESTDSLHMSTFAGDYGSERLHHAVHPRVTSGRLAARPPSGHAAFPARAVPPSPPGPCHVPLRRPCHVLRRRAVPVPRRRIGRRTVRRISRRSHRAGGRVNTRGSSQLR